MSLPSTTDKRDKLGGKKKGKKEGAQYHFFTSIAETEGEKGKREERKISISRFLDGGR